MEVREPYFVVLSLNTSQHCCVNQMFLANHWSLHLKVLPTEVENQLIKCGFSYIFPDIGQTVHLVQGVSDTNARKKEDILERNAHDLEENKPDTNKISDKVVSESEPVGLADSDTESCSSLVDTIAKTEKVRNDKNVENSLNDKVVESVNFVKDLDHENSKKKRVGVSTKKRRIVKLRKTRKRVKNKNYSGVNHESKESNMDKGDDDNDVISDDNDGIEKMQSSKIIRYKRNLSKTRQREKQRELRKRKCSSRELSKDSLLNNEELDVSREKEIRKVHVDDTKIEQEKLRTIENNRLVEVTVIRCEYCNELVSNSLTLKVHMEKQHGYFVPEYECRDCYTGFDTKEELTAHRGKEGHFKQLPRKRGVQFCDDIDLEIKVQCRVCHKYYSGQRTLRQHCYREHKDIMPKFECTVCNQAYETRDELWEHKRKESHGCSSYMFKAHLCDICGKSLKTLMSFKEHKLICEANMENSCKFTCEQCGAQFKTKTYFQTHVRNVHLDRPMTCHICGQSCKNARSLQEHRRRHDETNKKHACKDCEKTFFSKTLLTAHVRTHTKEKPFKCALCNYGCAVKQNLPKHARKKHKHLTDKECKDYSIILKPMDSISVNSVSTPTLTETRLVQQKSLISNPEAQNQSNSYSQALPVVGQVSVPESFVSNQETIPTVISCDSSENRISRPTEEPQLFHMSMYATSYSGNAPKVSMDMYYPLPSHSGVQPMPPHAVPVNDWNVDKSPQQSVETEGNIELDLRIRGGYYEESDYQNKPVAPVPAAETTGRDQGNNDDSAHIRIQSI